MQTNISSKNQENQKFFSTQFYIILVHFCDDVTCLESPEKDYFLCSSSIPRSYLATGSSFFCVHLPSRSTFISLSSGQVFLSSMTQKLRLCAQKQVHDCPKAKVLKVSFLV